MRSAPPSSYLAGSADELCAEQRKKRVEYLAAYAP